MEHGNGARLWFSRVVDSAQFLTREKQRILKLQKVILITTNIVTKVKVIVFHHPLPR